MRAKIKDEKTGKWRWLNLPQSSAMFGPPPNLIVNADKKPKLVKVWTSGEKEMVRK